MEIDQIPQESLNGDNTNQEQLDLSDFSMSDNHSPPNNNPPTSPILEEPSEATYERPSKKSKTDLPTNIPTLDKPLFPNLPNPYKQKKKTITSAKHQVHV